MVKSLRYCQPPIIENISCRGTVIQGRSIDASIIDSDMTDARIENCVLAGSLFKNCNVTNTSFKKTNVQCAFFKNCTDKGKPISKQWLIEHGATNVEKSTVTCEPSLTSNVPIVPR